MEEKQIFKKDDIEKKIKYMSRKIYEDFKNTGTLAIVGIQTRGVEIANRIRKNIEELSGKKIPHGILDITFYRDDLATRGYLPTIKETRIEFDITGMTIVIIDDVIFTGRTIKAALETLTSFGRPKAIKLCTLVDRGNRELPIQPDFCGFNINSKVGDEIKVRLYEIDGTEDAIYYCENK